MLGRKFFVRYIPLHALVSVLVGLVLCNDLFAQPTGFPSKPIVLVVPYTAGGGVDTIARMIAPPLSKRLGQPIVIENKPGVSGIVGTQFVAHTKPNGYTLLAGNTTTNATNFLLTKNSGYDPIKDFVPVAMLDGGPTVLVVAAGSRFNSVQDIIKELKEKPGSLNYGSSGTGSAHHLTAELFQSMTKTKMQHIPYKGSTNVDTDIIGGQLDLTFEVIPVALPFIKSKHLKALGVSSRVEMPALPGVKPIAELGIPGFEMSTWKGIFAPAGTPPDIAEYLGREISAVVKMPDIEKKMQDMGLIPDSRRNAEFADFQRQDIARWDKLFKQANIVAE